MSRALDVAIDDFLEPRRGPGRPPKLRDGELITLAVAQVFLAMPNDRQFSALARWRLGHLFPQLLDQSQYNRRLRALAPQIGRVINYLARNGPPLGAGGQRRPWLLPLAQPLVLGLSALRDLLPATGCRNLTGHPARAFAAYGR